ncbi:hypothetical protein OEZ85_002921 [Tetradesmus obliquus]|uniref:DUF1254 domain-containing protein n=1 Tax=Tetradesmus obliquus TaxID=3088 RepID=A0ABY8TZ07_TETOB|nr:hypothetical protein OEZ85_002921 [Tetradesmus obliquus]
MAAAAQSTAIKRGAINRLLNAPTLITAQNQQAFGIVAPKSDTLYTSAWLDLTAGPQVLSAPNTNGRYYVMELLDFYTNVIGNPGAPTTGTAASKWAVLPPGYKQSSLPQHLRSLPSYQSNTTAVWVLGRTYVSTPADTAAAKAVQVQYSLAPATAPSSSSSSAASIPATSTHLGKATSAANALLQQAGWKLGTVTNATAAFSAIMGLAKAFPPDSTAASPLALAPQLGLNLGRGFDQPGLTKSQQAALQAGWVLGQECITAFAAADGSVGVAQPSGWSYSTKAGRYGSSYLLRAAVALVGIGANEPNTTVYASNWRDANGQPLNGSLTSSITVTGAPPASAFASLTLYSAVTNMLMSNPASDRSVLNFKATPGLQWNSDVSITVYLSSKPPGALGSKQRANWLPAAQGEPFWVALRMYGPSAEVVSGDYKLLPIVRVQP